MKIVQIDRILFFSSYLRLKFGSGTLAAEAMEILKNYKPDDREITLEHFGENDSEGGLCF